MATPRDFIRSTLAIAGALGVVAVLHEFGVKYAEQVGWYDNLPSKVEIVMNWLISISEPLWFKLLTMFFLGAAAGMWVDAKLKDKEGARERLDREAVAAEAERLSRKLGQIAAEGAAREQVAWQEDIEVMMQGRKDGQIVIPNRDRSTTARARTLEKYGDYHYEVEALIAKAAKCISLDRGDLWQVSHILSSGRDLGELSRFLAKISVSIRHPQKDLPITDVRMAIMHADNEKKSDSSSKSTLLPEL